MLEAVVSLFILSLMLLGGSRLIVEQSAVVAVSRLDSRLWQFADSFLEQRTLVRLDRDDPECPLDTLRCEQSLDPVDSLGAWPASTNCPGCRLTLILESPTNDTLAEAPFIRESLVVSWVDRGRRRELRHGRIRS